VRRRACRSQLLGGELRCPCADAFGPGQNAADDWLLGRHPVDWRDRLVVTEGRFADHGCEKLPGLVFPGDFQRLLRRLLEVGHEHRWWLQGPRPHLLVLHEGCLELRGGGALRPHHELRRSDVQDHLGRLRSLRVHLVQWTCLCVLRRCSHL